MLLDREFRRKVGAAQSVVSLDVDVASAGSDTRVVLDSVRDTAGLPAIARKIAGDTTQAKVVEVWADSTTATTEITAPGKPTRAEGTITLVADGDGTRYVLALEVKVKVPLVAAKLEKIMADDIVAGLRIEEKVASAWLGGDR